MNENIKNLKKTVSFMKKEGILVLKTKDCEIELTREALLDSRHKKNLEPSSEKPDKIESPEYSEQDVLFWSSPGFLPEEAQ